MCQGSCSTTTCQQTCSPTETRLRHALAEIQTMANQQLQALLALRGKDGQEPPAAFAMQLIATRATSALDEAPAPAAPAPAAQPMLFHRPSQPGPRSWDAKCGCRSTADCNCMSMDTAARLMYQSHEQHRRAA